MEEVDEHLMIANIEILCWKEQLKQVVHQSHKLIIFNLINFSSDFG